LALPNNGRFNMSNDKKKDFEDDETKLRMRTEMEEQFAKLLDDAGALDEVTQALGVPDSTDAAAFAKLAGDLYRAVISKAGLEQADQNEVALVATPESLLALAAGGDLGPDNPLQRLVTRRN
jgi:hypothetical protein